jgi:ElaB/YqjD/DUF883 family membrane-anchored ribosome-binding protein
MADTLTPALHERRTPTRWTTVTERARHLTHRARRFVQERPLQAIALTVGLGFVVGKVLDGRDE